MLAPHSGACIFLACFASILPPDRQVHPFDRHVERSAADGIRQQQRVRPWDGDGAVVGPAIIRLDRDLVEAELGVQKRACLREPALRRRTGSRDGRRWRRLGGLRPPSREKRR